MRPYLWLYALLGVALVGAGWLAGSNARPDGNSLRVVGDATATPVVDVSDRDWACTLVSDDEGELLWCTPVEASG